MASSSPDRTKFYAAFAAIYIVWGSTYLAIRYAVETIPPFIMAGTRFILAGAMLYLVARLQGIPHPTRVQWRNAVIIGLFLLLGGNGAVVWAEQTVPSGIAALLVAIVPLWIVFVDWIRPNGNRPSAGVLLGVAVGLGGMIQLVGIDTLRGQSGAIPAAGVIALMFGSLSWATGTVIAKQLDLAHSIAGSGAEMLGGGVGLMAASLVNGEWQTFHPSAMSAASIGALAYLLVFGSLIGYTAYSWLIRNASPSLVGTYAYVNPVVAVLLGWVIAGETITTQTLIGAAIIVGAVVVITTAQARASQKKRASVTGVSYDS